MKYKKRNLYFGFVCDLEKVEENKYFLHEKFVTFLYQVEENMFIDLRTDKEYEYIDCDKETKEFTITQEGRYVAALYPVFKFPLGSINEDDLSFLFCCLNDQNVIGLLNQEPCKKRGRK